MAYKLPDDAKIEVTAGRVRAFEETCKKYDQKGISYSVGAILRQICYEAFELAEEPHKPKAGEVWQYKKYPPFVICETKYCHTGIHGHGIDGRSAYLVDCLSDIKFLAPSLEEYFREKHDEP